MQEYYFLFALALIWTIFAVFQDMKKREVANWLNFSLIAIALAYRAFYATITSNYKFFLLGAIGFAIFLGLAYTLYYARAFAGGDAKLLMGFGIILPYTNYLDLFTLSIVFLFLLFFLGAVYSLFYSIFIVSKNRKTFKKEFKIKASKNKTLLIGSLILFVITFIYALFNPTLWFLSIIFISPVLIIYTKSLEKCMIVLLPPEKLTEGDWLEKDVKIGKRTVKKSVHGISFEEIKFFKKHKKKILIKQGIPFTPSFLLALITMVSFFLISKSSLPQLLSSLL